MAVWRQLAHDVAGFFLMRYGIGFREKDRATSVAVEQMLLHNLYACQ
jgi:hypothetical protein